MTNYKILVCGGRDFDDRRLLYTVLDGLHSDQWGSSMTIIHGNARGADSLVGEWAEDRGVECEVYPAKWHLYGKQAGYLRNVEMLEDGEPDLVIAFEGGRGTEMMKNIARKAGVPVEEY